MHFVLVADVEDSEPVGFPTEDNGTLAVSTLDAHYPGFIGLQFRINSRMRAVKLNNGILYPPENGWGDTIYHCIFQKYYTKRKTNDALETSKSKTSQMYTKSEWDPNKQKECIVENSSPCRENDRNLTNRRNQDYHFYSSSDNCRSFNEARTANNDEKQIVNLTQLPDLSNSSFTDLKNNQAYVDKTAQLDDFIMNYVERRSIKMMTFVRPRRFGKSLFLDTLAEFYSGRKDSFKNTLIYDRRLSSEWKYYPVLKLDFSCLNCSNLETSLLEHLRLRCRKLQISFESNNVTTAIEEILLNIYDKCRQYAIILIDEYDYPYTTAKDSKTRTNNLDILRSFFTAIKGNRESTLFTFITGTTHLLMSGLGSGFNCGINISMDPEVCSLLGFTEDELKLYFQKFIDDVSKSTGHETSIIYKNMKAWYNGYKFSNSDVEVFNPSSVISYLRSLGTESRFWTLSTANPSTLVNLMKHFPYQVLQLVKPELLEISFVPKTIILSGVDFEDICEETLQVILYQFGYLTLGDYNAENQTYTLRIPNGEIEEHFVKLHLKLMKLKSECVGVDFKTFLEKVQKAVQTREWNLFVDFANFFFAMHSYQIYLNGSRTNENIYQVIIYFLMILAECNSGTLENRMNREPSDITMRNGNDVYIFKLKMDDDDTNPLNQILEKYSSKYTNQDKSVFCIGLIIGRQLRCIVRWGVLQLNKKKVVTTKWGELKPT